MRGAGVEERSAVLSIREGEGCLVPGLLLPEFSLERTSFWRPQDSCRRWTSPQRLKVGIRPVHLFPVNPQLSAYTGTGAQRSQPLWPVTLSAAHSDTQVVLRLHGGDALWESRHSPHIKPPLPALGARLMSSKTAWPSPRKPAWTLGCSLNKLCQVLCKEP